MIIRPLRSRWVLAIATPLYDGPNEYDGREGNGCGGWASVALDWRPLISMP